MATLEQCPCGAMPDDLSIYADYGDKWAIACAGNCCGEWEIEFRTLYNQQGSDELKALAIAAWNNAPRGTK